MDVDKLLASKIKRVDPVPVKWNAAMNPYFVDHTWVIKNYISKTSGQYLADHTPESSLHSRTRRTHTLLAKK